MQLKQKSKLTVLKSESSLYNLDVSTTSLEEECTNTSPGANLTKNKKDENAVSINRPIVPFK